MDAEAIIQDLKGELMVALAERDQADQRVNELQDKVKAQEEFIEELCAMVRQLKEVEQWRQAHWDELKIGLEELRKENKTLRSQLWKLNSENTND
jgi:uncharacterized coiled-coil protein SlyX